MACAADRDAVVREVAELYEVIKLQHPLLLLHSQQQPPQLAQSLLGKALRALNLALSVMKQQQPAVAPVTSPVSVVVKAEPHHQLSLRSPASADSEAMAPSRRGAKRRSSAAVVEGKKKTSSSSSWSTLTAVPYDDGYEWRKYGEKKINGTPFITRNYFRCTYRDDVGCLATKHVQQMDNNSDPIMFHVTYNNSHTCNTSAKANTGRQHAAAAAAMNMKQEEPPLLLPALVDLDLQPSAACFPHEQIIPQCQQEPLFPVSVEQQFVCGALRDDDGEIPSASATGSCVSGETSCWDGCYYWDMAAVEDDDPLHDLERFLFMD